VGDLNTALTRSAIYGGFQDLATKKAKTFCPVARSWKTPVAMSMHNRNECLLCSACLPANACHSVKVRLSEVVHSVKVRLSEVVHSVKVRLSESRCSLVKVVWLSESGCGLVKVIVA
jgi:hypothetical protein